jgi:hypothetical protein
MYLLINKMIARLVSIQATVRSYICTSRLETQTLQMSQLSLADYQDCVNSEDMMSKVAFVEV